MTVALVAGRLAAATAGGGAGGPIPTGVGSVPVSPIHAAASRLDQSSKARAVTAAHRFCRAYARQSIEKRAQ